MSQKYFKPVKKFVSRKTAMERLKLKDKQFNRLCVLCSVYPVVADQKHCYDRVDGWYYKIDDMKRIFHSGAYEVLNKNHRNDEKKDEYLKFEQYERASRIVDDEVNYIELVKQKYSCLGHSIEDLGNTLRNLYFIDLLSIDNVSPDLEAFERFIIDKGLLNKAFLSKKGIYYGFNCGKIIVCWFVPYPGYGLDTLVEEKQETPEPRPKFDFDFLDFGLLSEETESEEILDLNDSSKMDMALLKYASPLLKIHLKLILHKLGVLYTETPTKRCNIFNRSRFFVDIKSIPRQIEFIIRNGGGEVTPLDEANIVVSEIVDDIREGVVYIQPQYIFDSLNQSKMIAFDDYLVGKETLPVHASPFPSIMGIIDERALKTLSNRKKYDILDRIEIFELITFVKVRRLISKYNWGIYLGKTFNNIKYLINFIKKRFPYFAWLLACTYFIRDK